MVNEDHSDKEDEGKEGNPLVGVQNDEDDLDPDERRMIKILKAVRGDNTPKVKVEVPNMTKPKVEARRQRGFPSFSRACVKNAQ